MHCEKKQLLLSLLMVGGLMTYWSYVSLKDDQHFISKMTSGEKTPISRHLDHPNSDLLSNLHHDKWIVVTTIQRPTPQLTQLAQIPGWQLVVAGDSKTPADFNLRGAIYLDLQAQAALGYRIEKLISYGTYTRKNIAYLFAVQHGAKIIYETDDDNFPDHLGDIFQLTLLSDFGLIVDANTSSHNPYPHFGQASIWPRGFPLENIGQRTVRRYKVCTTSTPAIQQGLVNGDPDVDAIYRLTRKATYHPLDVTFDVHAPPVILPHGTFAPFNSQNTLFHSKSFWALFLPTTVTMRATDIYRGYWAQRLLWQLGEYLAFYPPNAKQVRNAHSYMLDFKEETGLYHDMDAFLGHILEWQCQSSSFFDCVGALSKYIVAKGYWKEKDAELIDAWLRDLIDVGYKEPVMTSNREAQAGLWNMTGVVFHPVEQNTSFPHIPQTLPAPGATNTHLLLNLAAHICSQNNWNSQLHLAKPWNNFQDILLIISIKDFHIIPYLEVYYRPHFANILYCGKKVPSSTNNKAILYMYKVSYIVIAGSAADAVSCAYHALQMKYNVKGMLYTSEDMLLMPNQLATRNLKSLWVSGIHEGKNLKSSSTPLCKDKKQHCYTVDQKTLQAILLTNLKEKGGKKKKFQDCLYKMTNSINGNHVIVTDFTIVDMLLYIPARLLKLFYELVSVDVADDPQSYMTVVVLLLGCMENTTEYVIARDITNNSHNITKGTFDYIFPFHVNNVQKDSMSNELFCR